MNAEKKKQLRREKRIQAAIKEMKKAEKAEKKGKTGNIASSKKSSKKSFFGTFIVALIVCMIVLVPTAYAVNKFLEKTPFQQEEEVNFEVLVDPESPFFQEFSDSKRINVLVLGVNTGLTDTIMLASFDPASKRVDIISIPRDTYYHREGYNTLAENKINAAFRKDPTNTAKAVSDVLLGMPINYYAVVEYDDIEKIVDYMGGVPIYIEKDMDYDDAYDKPPLHIHLKAGQQTLSGENSVKFLRYRHGYAEGDLGRVKAQQTWVKNAMSQAINFGVLKVANVAFDEIQSNINYKAMISLATKAIGMDSENITAITMPGTPDPESPYYVYPKDKEIEQLIRDIYSIKPEATTDEAIEE